MNQAELNHSAKEALPAVHYWDQVLDPQNLERDPLGRRTGDRPSLAEEIEFALTPDLEAARQWLATAPAAPAWLMDLGAGLGANSFALARQGRQVVAVDTSLARLRALRRRAAAAGLAGRIRLVLGAAEALPFADGSVPAIYTKSVLIHTNLERAAGELSRTLAPGGRAALVEPQPGNPFVACYRLLLAPRAWRSITRYFDSEAQEIFLRAPGLTVPNRPILPFYFLSFFAFVFQFGWPRPGPFKWTLRLLHGLDRRLFSLVPPLRRWAWFGLIRLEKRSGGHIQK